MLLPKRTKWRKTMKGRVADKTYRGAEIAFGTFALKAMESGRISNKQIEAARVAFTRFMKREGKVWIRIFPDKPITRKPLEVRMGKGKGNPEGWEAMVEAGRILFEVDGVSREVAMEAMMLAAHKMSVKTKFITRRDAVGA
ncbi:MAG: 50S ribosomal protein L16 [Chitinophagales bacterium]|nr:50S ribosomal protein L16 [Chitinophagales bacterium]